MADSNHGAGSAIAKDGVMTQGALQMTGMQASLKPITQALPSPLEVAPGSAASLALALADASLQIKHLADGQVRLVDTLELFNVSLLKVTDALEAQTAGNAEGTKTVASTDKRTPSQALDAAMTDIDQLLMFA